MTSIKKVASATLIASTLALAGCAMDDGYGYGGVSMGYGPGYYGDPYGPYDYAPFGWYDGYYYPGNGYWLYDRGGGRHRWDDRHRQYWEHRHEQAGNWNGPAVQPWQPGLRDNDGGRRRWTRDPAAGSSGHQWRGRGEGRPSQATPQPQPSAPPAAAPAPAGDNSHDGGRSRYRRGD